MVSKPDIILKASSDIFAKISNMPKKNAFLLPALAVPHLPSFEIKKARGHWNLPPHVKQRHTCKPVRLSS